MKTRQYYLNTALGDDYVYFRKGNNIKFHFKNAVYYSGITLSRFYRWLKEGKIVKK